MNLVLYFIYGIKIFRIHDINLSDTTHMGRKATCLGQELMQQEMKMVNDAKTSLKVKSFRLKESCTANMRAYRLLVTTLVTQQNDY